MKKVWIWLLSALLLLSLTACGSGKSSYMAEPADRESASPSYAGPGWSDTSNKSEYETSPSSPSSSPADNSAKMIYRASIELETMAFDDALNDIDQLVQRAGGYYEDQTVSGRSSGYRYADCVIRVPKDQFDSFCQQLGDVCHLTRMNRSQENVTEEYYDVESRLNTAKTKLARLQELLARAESMQDIITIESAIADVEWEIDNYSGSLRYYDNLVDYATVSLSLQEVYRLSGTPEAPLTLGDKIRNSFSEGLVSIGNFFEGLLLAVVYGWFWILLTAAVIFLIVWLIRRSSKKSQEKAQQRMAAAYRQQPPQPPVQKQ